VMIGEIAGELKDRMADSLHAIELYDHNNADFGFNPSYGVYDVDNAGKGTRYGGVNYNSTTDSYRYTAGGFSYYDYDFEQGKRLMLTDNNTWTGGSAYPVTINWKPGDSNMDAVTDVLDVQHTLNELLGSRDYYTYGFNYAAADLNTDDIYNILDVVKAVNIVLESQSVDQNTEASAAYAARTRTAGATVFAVENLIVLNSAEEVAAIDITLRGVSSAQIRQKVSKSDFQMLTRDIADGVRVVIFSPTGAVLPAGQNTVFSMSGYGVPTGVKCADASAREIRALAMGDLSSNPDIYIGDRPIAVRLIDDKLYVDCACDMGKGQVEVYSASGGLVFDSNDTDLPQGVTTFELDGLADGIYVVRVTAEEDCFIGKVKK